MSDVFDIYDSTSGSLQWTSCNSRRERADWEATGCCVLLQCWCCVLIQDFTHVPVLFLSYAFGLFLSYPNIIGVKYRASPNSQLMIVIILFFFFFSTKVTFDHMSICEITCGITALELLLQTAGAHSPVPHKSPCVRVRRIMPLKWNWLKLSLSLWSPMFQISVRIQ